MICVKYLFPSLYLQAKHRSFRFLRKPVTFFSQHVKNIQLQKIRGPALFITSKPSLIAPKAINTFLERSELVKLLPKSEVMDETRMHLHVLPTDLDIAVHMNNGRYLTLADLGRWDMMIRNGFWKTMRAKGTL
ncbi:hypothetical protein GQR58_030448 [Nymphon striatum]|nr:hypothetical protein GQR58_030448 [Nymphon striatum]